MRQEDIIGIFSGVFGCSLLLFMVAIGVFIWWRIFAKAGFGGPFGLLMVIPVVNLVMLFVLAFAKWPVEKELDELRRQQYR
jgi:hypothetical protein